MIEKVGHIKNPLSVIAMFAALTETTGTIVLPLIESGNQEVYIWFLMLFPVFLVGIFFLTLNCNHKVLYAPSDYKNEDNFLKSFSKATAQEKVDKLKEEVQEAGNNFREENTGQENDNLEGQVTSKPNDSPTNPKIFPSTIVHNASLIANVFLAEKLAILKLSKDMKLEFKTDIRFETSNKRKIIFDGVAQEKDKVHAVEVKFFRSEIIIPSPLEKVLLEAELVANQMKIIDYKELILHFVAVIDNPEIDTIRLKSRLERYVSKYNVNVKLHIFSLSDLENEYQYRP